jgi:hypothetical protein
MITVTQIPSIGHYFHDETCVFWSAYATLIKEINRFCYGQYGNRIIPSAFSRGLTLKPKMEPSTKRTMITVTQIPILMRDKARKMGLHPRVIVAPEWTHVPMATEKRASMVAYYRLHAGVNPFYELYHA